MHLSRPRAASQSSGLLLVESFKGHLSHGAIRSVERTEAALSELGACLAEEEMIISTSF